MTIGSAFGDPRLPARFWAKVLIEPNTGCWLWRGALVLGYGRFGAGTRAEGTANAHRYAYERLVGPVPDGLELDHVKVRGCIGPACCNPAHLEPVTHAVNCQRGEAGAINGARQRAKTHCAAGHPLQQGTQSRWCPSCANARRAAARRCKNGHEFTPENTYWGPSGRRRGCMECRRQAAIDREHVLALEVNP